MNLCISCNRTFGSQKALQQHQKTSSRHGGTFRCEPCNRSFGSNGALKQHQGDSPAHQQSPEDTITIPSICVPTVNSDSLVLPMNSQVDLLERMSQLSCQATSNDTKHIYSALVLPSMVLGDKAQARTLYNRGTAATRPKVAKLPVPEQREEARTFFAFPELHQNIAGAVTPEITSTWFNDNNNDEDFDHEYSTCIRAEFTCDNKACKKSSWGSGVVTILIRGYSRNGYSAIVFNQRCKACNRLGTPKLNMESYIERVAYRLKKWAGVMATPPPFRKKSGPEHERDFCEGCKKGICPQTVID